MPWCGTMSFDTAGRTMMGVTSAAMVQMVEKLRHPPLAFGANCGVGASDLLRTVLGFAAQGTERPIIAKGNAGIPKYHDGHIHYDGTPELMAEYAVLARDSGARSSAAAAARRPTTCARCARRWRAGRGGRARRWRRSPRRWGASLRLGRNRRGRRRGPRTAQAAWVSRAQNSESWSPGRGGGAKRSVRSGGAAR
jgi:hypothetical protein